MKIQAFLLLALAMLASGQGGLAQGGRGQASREARISPVPFERILGANQEPQNWLTYSGTTMSQRYSALTQITPDNAKDLALQWVFQSRSLDKHEVTPLVVDGVMYTIQSPNDVIALDATTGRTIWTYAHKPAPENPQPVLRQPDAGRGDSEQQTFHGYAGCATDRHRRAQRQGIMEDTGSRL